MMKLFHLTATQPLEKTRKNNGCGGVLVAIRNDNIGTHQVDLDTDCKIVWVRNQLSGSKEMLTGAFYSIPNNNHLDNMEKLWTIRAYKQFHHSLPRAFKQCLFAATVEYVWL